MVITVNRVPHPEYGKYGNVPCVCMFNGKKLEMGWLPFGRGGVSFSVFCPWVRASKIICSEHTSSSVDILKTTKLSARFFRFIRLNLELTSVWPTCHSDGRLHHLFEGSPTNTVITENTYTEYHNILTHIIVSVCSMYSKYYVTYLDSSNGFEGQIILGYLLLQIPQFPLR